MQELPTVANHQQAKRTRGICACGHEGVLPWRVDGAPACRLNCLGMLALSIAVAIPYMV